MTPPDTASGGLLPCGCGAPARWVELAWRVKCTRPSCGIIGGAFETRRAAIAAWNTRATPSVDEEMLEALRRQIINTPETADFMAGVPLEASHQRDRWAAEHDAGKSPFDWFWLIGYLAQKAATSAVAGDTQKALHHTVSTAAALANWHAALSGASTAMRPGIALGAADQAATS